MISRDRHNEFTGTRRHLFKAAARCSPHHFTEDFQMSVSTSFKSALSAAVSTPEAIALQVELLTLTRDAGKGLRRFSEQVALDILHGVAFFITLAVWGLVELIGWAASELRREFAGIHLALLPTAFAEPDCVVEAPAVHFEAWSNEIEIVWPEPSPDAPQWVTGMMVG